MNSSEAFSMFVFQRGKKYENIYQTLVSDQKIFSNMQELLFLAASIGFKKKCKREFEPGIDMRGEHLSSDSMAVFYSMYVNHLKDDYDSLDLLNDKDELRRFLKNDVVEYAEGGMEILCKDVFNNTWDSKELTLRKDYDEYLEDIMTYIKSDVEEVDF